MTSPPSVPSRLRGVAEIVAFAGVYVATARAGLGMDAVSGFATLVWAPTGLSLAALLLVGYRLWPAIAIGAFVANLLTGAPVGVALGIAAGNTLEALAGAYLLRRVSGFRTALDRVSDVLALIALAAVASTALSATIGLASLFAGGLVAPGAGPDTWRAWWIGDLVGDLFVAPMLLVWLTPPVVWPSGRRLAEAVMVSIVSLGVALLVFGPASDVHQPAFTQAYIFFPVLIWAALRFGQRGAVSTAFLVSTITIWGTAAGRGPFVHPALHESLFALQTFMAVAAATFLVLGAASDERERATTDLERAVADAQEARDLAAAANHAKGEFLAVMSHELRTPLNAIFGFTELLILGVNGPLTDEQRATVDRIRRNQVHLLGLVTDVLRFARIEAGSLTFDIQPVRLRDTFYEVESAIEPEARRKAIVVRREVSNPALAVLADPDKLRQIVLNVATNAVKFTPDGGIVTLSARGDGDSVCITVHDTGIGIPEDRLTRVLEPFFQVEGGKTRQHGGVGLGLAIARDLARAMNGAVSVDSRLGESTTVSIVLPRATDATGPELKP